MIDILEKDNLLARANEIGERFSRRAKTWQSRFNLIGEVRGLGAMQALELVKSRNTREPAPEETNKITQYCYEHGLITITAGSYGNVIRVLVPLVITDGQIDEALGILEQAFASVSGLRTPVAEMATN